MKYRKSIAALLLTLAVSTAYAHPPKGSKEKLRNQANGAISNLQGGNIDAVESTLRNMLKEIEKLPDSESSDNFSLHICVLNWVSMDNEAMPIAIGKGTSKKEAKLMIYDICEAAPGKSAGGTNANKCLSELNRAVCTGF